MDHRQARRRHLIYYLRVNDLDTGATLGHVADVSRAGLLLVGDAELRVGQRLRIDVELPEEPGFLGESFEVAAEVRWTGNDRNPSLGCAGLLFLDAGPAVEANVDLLVKLIGFSDR